MTFTAPEPITTHHSLGTFRGKNGTLDRRCHLMMPVCLIKVRTRPWAQTHMAIIGNSSTKGHTHPHLLARRTISNRHHTTQPRTRTTAQIRASLLVVTRPGFQAWEYLASQGERCRVRVVSNHLWARIGLLISCRWNNLLASYQYTSSLYFMESTGGMAMGSSPYGSEYD